MKIALVAQHTSLLDQPGTAQDPERARLRELSRSLASSGHQVTVYTRRSGASAANGEQVASGVRVARLGPADDPAERDGDLLAGVPTFSAALGDRLGHDRPDVLHAVRWTSGLAALAASRGRGIPVVQSFQSLGIAERRHRMMAKEAGTERLRLEPAIGRSVTAVLAGSTGEESDLTRLGVPRRSITVVPDGVDLAEFTPEGPVADRGGRPRLITVSDLKTEDGLETLLRALAKIPGAELVVAGGPQPGDLHGHPEHARLAALAGSLGLGDRLTFTGRVQPGELPPLLRSADLYVSACEYEPSPGLSLRAMACGTPVVASAMGGHVDAVLDGTTGMLVPPARPALLAQRIRQLLGHPMLLSAYSVAAVDRARSRYSWDRIAQETVAVYDEALAKAA
jgi:glycosyltransferase involved in cell wall biosynthesis